jgi:hypothetical protein
VGSAYPFFINLKKYNIMACTFISDGRALNCKDSVGGLKAVYFAAFDEGTSIAWVKDATDDTIDDVTTAGTVYKYDLKGNSTFEQTINSSRENGTVFYEQALNLTLPKLSAVDNKAVKLLASTNPQVIVEDYNGNLFLVGRQHGADVSGGTIVTGGAMGDMSGYTLSFTGMETSPAEFLAPTEVLPTTWDFPTADVTIVIGS